MVFLAQERGYDVDCVSGVDHGYAFDILFLLNKKTIEKNDQRNVGFSQLRVPG
jgi:hypothetical protein